MGRDIFKWGREIFPVEGNVSRGWKGDFAGERKGGSIFQGEGGTFFQGKGGGMIGGVNFQSLPPHTF